MQYRMKHIVISFYCLETSHGLVCSQQIFENVISSTKENTNDLKNQSAQKHIFTISEQKRNLHVLIRRFDPVACLGLMFHSVAYISAVQRRAPGSTQRVRKRSL